MIKKLILDHNKYYIKLIVSIKFIYKYTQQNDHLLLEILKFQKNMIPKFVWQFTLFNLLGTHIHIIMGIIIGMYSI